MKRRKYKGRKIYKTKEKNYYDKSFGGKFFSLLLTLILLGGVAFIGYSFAEPMLNFSKKAGDTVSENLNSIVPETAVSTETVTTQTTSTTASTTTALKTTATTTSATTADTEFQSGKQRL